MSGCLLNGRYGNRCSHSIQKIWLRRTMSRMTSLAALGHRSMHILTGKRLRFVTGKTGLLLLLLQQTRENGVMGIMAGIALTFFNRRMQVGLSLEGLLHLLVAGKAEPGPVGGRRPH
jgi:hypothetical protein